MRPLAIALAITLRAAVCLPAEPPAAPASGTYNISGLAVRQGGNQPLKRVRVTITENDHPDQQATLLTGQDGRFKFVNVPRGKFTLSAEFRGGQYTYQQDGPFSTGIVTGPGFDTEHILFTLPPATGLVVKVVDEEGEPVHNAQLFLIHEQVANGWSQTTLYANGMTTSGGEGHFAHLDPGVYYVAAHGQPWYAQPVNPQMAGQETDPAQRDPMLQKLDVAYPLTYYGNTQAASAAVPIHIESGSTPQVEINLRAMPSAHVEFTGTEANEQIMTNLESVGPGGVLLPVNAVSSWADGSRRGLNGVAPGQYLLAISRVAPGRQPEPLGSRMVNLSGDTHFDLDASSGATSVAGTLKLSSSDAPRPQGLWLTDPRNNVGAWAQLAADASFRFRAAGNGSVSGNVLPGRYEIGLNSNELYIESLEAKGGLYSEGLLEVRPGASVTITVTAAKGLLSVDGIALNAEKKPVSGAMILLLPQDPVAGLFVPRDQSDGDGTFTLQRAHPGRYLLIAIDKGRGLAYHDRAQLKPYLAKARAVEIPLRSGVILEAEVQPRQP